MAATPRAHGDARVIHIDGGSRGNPGPAASAAVAFEGGRIAGTLRKHLGEATNNVAEYEGLLLAFALARRLRWRRFQVRSDSELLVRQWSGEYRMRNAGLAPLLGRARREAEAFEEVLVSHVPREGNVAADAAVNAELDRRASGRGGGGRMRPVPMLALAAAILAAGCAGTQVPRERIAHEGEGIFNGHKHPTIACYRCHDGDASGTLRGPGLAGRVPRRSDDQIYQAIHDGPGRMPAFAGELSDEEMQQIIDWLRSRFPKKGS